jgi:Mg/Co/Ni transporter MgtE
LKWAVNQASTLAVRRSTTVPVIVHDVAQFIQQALVVGLVLGGLIVAMLAHETFFQCEMSRDGAEQVTEDFGDLVFRYPR